MKWMRWPAPEGVLTEEYEVTFHAGARLLKARA
jgi:hypothetical protein